MDYLRKTGIVQWSISGVLVGLGFVFPSLWPVGIAGVAYFIYLTQQEQSVKKCLIGGFVAWTIKAACAIIWFWSVYPIEVLPVDFGEMQLVIIGLYWIITACWLGLGGIGAVLFLRWLLRSQLPRTLVYGLLPLLWIAGELLGSLLFSIMTYGEGGAITTAFSFGYVGYLVAEHQWLLQIARVFGVYSLGYVFVLVSFILLQKVPGWMKRRPITTIGFLAALFLTSYIPSPDLNTIPGESLQVITVDTAFPKRSHLTVDGAQEIQAELEEALQVALERDPDYVLFPEDARYFNQSVDPEQAQAVFSFLNQNPETVIVDTGRVEIDEQAVLQAFIYNGQEQSVDISQKRYLVPQGEFMPLLYGGLLKLIGFSEAVDQVTQSISYTVGPLTSQADFSSSSPGILFCFESTSPWGVKKILSERGSVPFIAHPISHAWFNEPKVFWQNLDRMLLVQAVWSQQYIVSVGGHVPGQVYTPNGHLSPLEDIASGEYWTVREIFIPQSR